MSGDSFCAPLHPHTPPPFTSTQFVMYLLQVLGVLGLIWKCRAEVSRLRLHLLWTFAPLVSSKVSFQNFACRGTKKKKKKHRQETETLRCTWIILSISCIEFFSASEGQLCHLRLLPLEASLYRLIFFFDCYFFLHNFHVIVAKLNICIESCERKSNFHLLPQTFRKENISSQIFLFTDRILNVE